MQKSRNYKCNMNLIYSMIKEQSNEKIRAGNTITRSDKIIMDSKEAAIIRNDFDNIYLKFLDPSELVTEKDLIRFLNDHSRFKTKLHENKDIRFH